MLTILRYCRCWHAGIEPQVLRSERFFVQPFSNNKTQLTKLLLAREVQREKKKVGGYLAARLRGCLPTTQQLRERQSDLGLPFLKAFLRSEQVPYLLMKHLKERKASMGITDYQGGRMGHLWYI